MNSNSLFTSIVIIFAVVGCNNSTEKPSLNKKINYSNINQLDSLIQATSYSTETLFLGFKIGMTETEFEEHIGTLRGEGKKINYSKSNIFTNATGKFELGEGYTFETKISMKESGKTLIGKGNYFIEPLYNTKGNLIQLNILPVEKWEGDFGFEQPNWLERNIKENSKRLADKELKQALIDNQFLNNSNFIRSKDEIIIYESSPIIKYIDLKSLLIELLNKEKEKEMFKNKDNKLKF